MNNSTLFFNRCFDKKRLKIFILWFFNKYGERETIQLIESLKKVGFQYATGAGISIGIDDLKIPFIKSDCINITEQKVKGADVNYQRGNITEIERQQQFVAEWSFVSEKLKRHVIQFFKATNIFNPIYMMAFSGARGNISQIRQLIGMRGLMADPQGQILDFPIRSSFREGLTLIEYLISCYGARKGVVDTALRTATSGYLTRRLVDVTQQVVVGRQDCHTNRGIQFTNLSDGTKVLLPLKDRLIGRVLLEDICIISPLTKKALKIGFKNQEISARLAKKICDTNKKTLIRSPLTCYSKNSICQLCYGWSLAYNAIVSIGEAVGVLAAQSIGEPGTQLTMRTFHTGGVFTGGLIDQIYAPFNGEVNYLTNFNGILIRTLKGRVGFLTKNEGALQIKTKYISNLNTINQGSKPKLASLFIGNQLKKNIPNRKKIQLLLKKILNIEKNFKVIKDAFHPSLVFNIPRHAILFIRQGSLIKEKELIAELSSISIEDTRRQETEKEIFAPITGQVFFEKLILIEKTKRDGSVYKTTYGLGSLWVVSSAEWYSLISPSIFPLHGDFISNSSVVQKLQILNEKFCYFDQSICDSLYAFEIFKSRFFLTKQIPDLYFKPKLFDNILLNRTFHSNNFQKIYYKDFRYFVLIKNVANNVFNNCFYSKRNILPIREYVNKKNQSKDDIKSLVLGLNFRFYQNNPASRIQKQKSKVNFILYSIQNSLNQLRGGYFFSLILHKPIINSKLKNPITSRKGLNHLNKSLKKDIYQYWYSAYSASCINIRDISVLSVWSFWWKKLSKSFDFGLSTRNNSLYYLYRSFFGIKKDKFQRQKENFFQFEEYKVSRFFFIDSISQNFALYFGPSKFSTKCSWISSKQTISILVNRQASTNLQQSKLWFLSKSNNFQTYPACIYNYGNFNKVPPYIFSSFIEQAYNIVIGVKPILINPGLFTNLYNRKLYLNYIIIQNFLIFFYYQHFLNLKFDNYFFSSFKKSLKKIGFQTQFKVLAIPIFLINKKINHKSSSQIKKNFLKNEIFTFFKKDNLFKKNFKTQLNTLNWPCTCRSKTFMDEFGCFLNFGLGFRQNTYFDRNQIILDITGSKASAKFDLLDFFPYRNFHKLKIRFLAHRSLSKNLILFQKIEKQINLKFYYSEILNSGYNSKTQEYHKALLFNSINAYFTNFAQNSIKRNKSFHLFDLDNNFNFLFSKRIFLKMGFIQTLQIKTLFNLEYPILLKTYLPLRKEETKIFYFYKLKLTKDKISYLSFNDLVSFSLKTFFLNSIQKINYRKFLNNKVNTIQILYKNFDYCSIRNLVYINLSLCSLDGEVIYTNPKKQKWEKNFIVLTQSNLKSFKLKNPVNKVRSETLTLSNFLRYGTLFENQKVISTNGQVIHIDKKSFTIREAIPYLITSRSIINVRQGELIKKGSRLFTFLSYQVKTGDIIQGIPKIEEFFEARLTRDGLPLLTNLHAKIKIFFQTYRSKFSLFEATQKSFEKIQYLIIDEIQKVYCSQGIYIADKHLEIVVRQMTAKVQIIKGGKTGLLCGELIELSWIRFIEQKFDSFDSSEILYEPIILGITKSCLETESFISAASFQETTRILTKAAIQNKVDFIRGLKQNVILGNLVPAGTGFFSPLYIKYSKFD